MVVGSLTMAFYSACAEVQGFVCAAVAAGHSPATIWDVVDEWRRSEGATSSARRDLRRESRGGEGEPSRGRVQKRKGPDGCQGGQQAKNTT